MHILLHEIRANCIFYKGSPSCDPHPRAPSDPKNLILLWDSFGTHWVLLATFQPDRYTPAETAVQQTNEQTNKRTNKRTNAQTNERTEKVPDRATA